MTILTNEINCEIIYAEEFGDLIESIFNWYTLKQNPINIDVLDVNISSFENQMGGTSWQAKIYFVK